MQNYLKLVCRSPFSRIYAYVDSEDYVLAALLSERGIRTKQITELVKEGFSYHVIICKLRKRDEAVFLEALEALTRMLLVRGETDYPDACREILELIEQANA